MNDPHVIQTNFRIPANCRHEWMLFRDNECVGAICGVPGKKQIRHYSKTVPDASESYRAGVMDWANEVVEHLRYLCET